MISFCTSKVKASASGVTRDSKHRSDRPIEISPRDALAGSAPLSNASTLAQVVWDDTLSPTLVIAYRHPLATTTTEDQTLQERRSLPWRGKPLWGIGLTVQSELRLISLKVFPSNVPHM